jgi:hypothetical protein
LDVPPKMKVKGYMYPQMKKPVGMLYFIQLDMIDSYKVTTNINITIAVSINANFISGVMVSVLVSSAVDRGLACLSRVQ